MSTRTRHWFTGHLRHKATNRVWSCGHRHASRKKAQACAEKRWGAIAASGKAETYTSQQWSIPIEEVFSGKNWRAEGGRAG